MGRRVPGRRPKPPSAPTPCECPDPDVPTIGDDTDDHNCVVIIGGIPTLTHETCSLEIPIFAFTVVGTVCNNVVPVRYNGQIVLEDGISPLGVPTRITTQNLRLTVQSDGAITGSFLEHRARSVSGLAVLAWVDSNNTILHSVTGLSWMYNFDNVMPSPSSPTILTSFHIRLPPFTGAPDVDIAPRQILTISGAFDLIGS